ncbi:MAG: hypothetical protein ACE5FH_01685 [Candidatus Zixiibacteriota bacterium]
MTFDLDFNYPVSRERLRNALRIKGRKNASQFRLSVVWPDSTSDRTKLPAQSSRFRLATELFDLREEDQQYQLTIDRDLRCVDCGNGLTVDYTYTMTVPQNPGIDLIVQEIHGDHSGKQGSIMIRFSSQVPTDEVREHVSIDPAIPFSVEGSWRGVRLRGSFEPRASYTVKVSSGLMSTNGELMERDFSSNVVMGDLTPVV